MKRKSFHLEEEARRKAEISQYGRLLSLRPSVYHKNKKAYDRKNNKKEVLRQMDSSFFFHFKPLIMNININSLNMVGFVVYPTPLLIFGSEDEKTHKPSWWYVFYVDGHGIFNTIYEEPWVEMRRFDEYEKMFGKIKEDCIDILSLSEEKESELSEELYNLARGMDRLFDSLDFIDDCQEIYTAIEALNTRVKKKIHQIVNEAYE